jgi:predicted transcriptional regulator
MMGNPQMEKQIFAVLKKSDKNDRRKGCSLQELHKKTGLCRTTISKHVSILEAKGKVVVESLGNMKMVYLNEALHTTKNVDN